MLLLPTTPNIRYHFKTQTDVGLGNSENKTTEQFPTVYSIILSVFFYNSLVFDVY